MKIFPGLSIFLLAFSPLVTLDYAHADPIAQSPTFSSPDSLTPFTDALLAQRSSSSLLSRDARIGAFNSISNNKPGWATFASDQGDIVFLAAGVLLPLATDGKAGREHTLRTVDALMVSTALAQGLKVITHEKRPDGSDYASFPSGHASAAFTVATMQAHYHPRQALWWYGGAAIIGASRVALDKHYTHDVLAGATLGYLTAKLELRQRRGFVLRPFIKNAEPGQRVAGLSFSRSF